MRNSFTRRSVLQAGASLAAAALTFDGVRAADIKTKTRKRRSLQNIIGITTGGLDNQREARQLTALTLPKFVREELGMQMIDLNTRWLTSFEQSYIHQVREAVEDSDCFVSNLKVNHAYGNIYSRNTAEQQKAQQHAQQLIRVAASLGARWIRFGVPPFKAQDDRSKLHAHRKLAAYAKQHQVSLLVENLGWLKSDPNSIVRVVKAIGANCAACPDTGNWDDKIRYDALAQSFPGAASCDFKVFDLDALGKHGKYDIHRCFEIGWKAGFRGPWAIEHWNKDTKAYVRETSMLRDQIHKWMSESTGGN